MNSTFQLTIAAIVSVVAVHWIFLRILKIAKVKGLVDNPNARKLQKNAVPVLGGIAVFFGMIFGLMSFVAIDNGMTNTLVNPLAGLMPVLLGASVMLYVGSLDDILGLTPRARLIIEVLVMLGIIYGSGMCVDSMHGLWGVESFTWWIAVPLTVFAGVGIINAYNMVDGVNGLSSGLCIACSVILGIVFFKRQDFANSALAFSFGASLIPFYMHNVFGNRSRMFIGDGGTMVMGLLVSWFLIKILSSSNTESFQVSGFRFQTPGSMFHGEGRMGLVAMMLAIASVPVFDTLRVMTARVLRHESPFHADKTHLHHIFIATGVSHFITAVSELVINLLMVLIWYCSYKYGMSVDWQLYITIVAGCILIWGTYFFLRYQEKHNTKTFHKLTRVTRLTHLGMKQWWLALQGFLDEGAYEDYLVILREKYNKKFEDMNQKEKDAAAIVNYLQGRKNVDVEDIISEAGVEKLRVYPILFELEQEGVIDIISRVGLGAPKIVRISNVGLNLK